MTDDLMAVADAVAEPRLVLEPARCRCPHGPDWHAAGGCEARGCGCEVVPS